MLVVDYIILCLYCTCTIVNYIGSDILHGIFKISERVCTWTMHFGAVENDENAFSVVVGVRCDYSLLERCEDVVTEMYTGRTCDGFQRAKTEKKSNKNTRDVTGKITEPKFRASKSE